ncbi:MAG: DASS family sodium-coupled anion symporter [Gemmatimonadaceae bacterium]
MPFRERRGASVGGGTASVGAPAGTFRWPGERRRTTPTAPPPAGGPTLVEQWGQRVGIAVGLLLALYVYLRPAPSGLSTEGEHAIAVFIVAITLWVTNALPYGVTGLLGVALLGLTGAIKPSDAYSAFGSSAIFFLMGIFLIGGALVETGLSKRMALLFLSRFEGSPYGFAFGMMLAGVFATIWMPNQATTAMLFPIATEVAVALRLRPKESTYAKVLFFSMGWGALIGSNVSFLGSSRAALALGMLQKNYGTSISFLGWVEASWPVVALGILTTPLILRLVFKHEEVEFSSARRLLERAVDDLGPMQRPQYATLAILVLTVAAWVFLGGRKVDLAVIALLGATALFVFGVMKWERGERHIYWNIILMYGGAIALGAALERTGATKFLLTTALDGYQPSRYVAVLGTAVIALILSEFMSNAAALAVILPLAFTLANQVGASPTALVLATSFGSGLDFMFPISTAPNTIIFSSGYLSPKDFVRAGALMTLASIAILALVIKFYWPLIGLQ